MLCNLPGGGNDDHPGALPIAAGFVRAMNKAVFDFPKVGVPPIPFAQVVGNLLGHEWDATDPHWEVRQHTTAAGEARSTHSNFESILMLGTILVVLLVLMLFGAIPTWPHSKNWGYGPSGGVGLVLVILVILLLLNKL
jgi:hypothetical protein